MKNSSKKTKSILKKVGLGLFFLLLAFIFIKGSIGKVWSTPTATTTYAIYGREGTTLKLIMLPDNKAIFYTKNDQRNSEEYVLTDLSGVYGTHYFGNLWKLESSGLLKSGLFGYRWYTSGAEPVSMEIDYLAKHNTNNRTIQRFPATGRTTYSTLLFKDNLVNFESMWLNKEKTNEKFVSEILSNLKNTTER